MLHKSGVGSSFKGIMRRLFIFFLIVPVLFANLLQAERVERKIGIQTFTFSKQTIEELLPLVRECGVDAIGLSRHALSKKYPDAMVEPSMSDEQKAFLKKILADNNIKVVSYGVSTPTTEKAIRKLFSFVKEFGADTVIAEPSADKLPLWNKLCAEYGMKVAVHNHAKDAKRNPEFSDPKFVASMIADYPNVYACPDTGHWGRSGVNPVSGFKTLENKIGIIHFRDMNAYGLSAYDVPFGTGAMNIDAMLAELDRQKFDGWLLLEYGGWWKNTLAQKLAEVKKSVEYLKAH